MSDNMDRPPEWDVLDDEALKAELPWSEQAAVDMRRLKASCIDSLVQEAHQTSRKKGFWDNYDAEPVYHQTAMIAAALALVHSEVSEAVEVLRKSTDMGWALDADGKPTGFVSELADVVIRVFDIAGGLELPLGEAILAKMAHNDTRPHRHGKAF